MTKREILEFFARRNNFIAPDEVWRELKRTLDRRSFDPIFQRAKNREWSGREDLNLRPPAPKAGALPGCATPRLFCFIDSKPLQTTGPRSAALFRRKLRQNCVKLCQNPSVDPRCVKTDVLFGCLPIQLE